MKWLNDNWDRWEEEKPDWFTTVNISIIPSDLLPVKVLEKLGGKSKRRDSLKKMIAEEEKEARRGEVVVQEA